MNAPSVLNISAEQLRRAAGLKEQIDALQAALARLLGTPAPASVVPRARRKMSAAAIARIRASQKARWAKIRAARGKTSVKKPTRKISAAGRARLSALAKARWQKAKASGRKAL